MLRTSSLWEWARNAINQYNEFQVSTAWIHVIQKESKSSTIQFNVFRSGILLGPRISFCFVTYLPIMVSHSPIEFEGNGCPETPCSTGPESAGYLFVEISVESRGISGVSMGVATLINWKIPGPTSPGECLLRGMAATPKTDESDTASYEESDMVEWKTQYRYMYSSCWKSVIFQPVRWDCQRVTTVWGVTITR